MCYPDTINQSTHICIYTSIYTSDYNNKLMYITLKSTRLRFYTPLSIGNSFTLKYYSPARANRLIAHGTAAPNYTTNYTHFEHCAHHHHHNNTRRTHEICALRRAHRIIHAPFWSKSSLLRTARPFVHW